MHLQRAQPPPPDHYSCTRRCERCCNGLSHPTATARDQHAHSCHGRHREVVCRGKDTNYTTVTIMPWVYNSSEC